MATPPPRSCGRRSGGSRGGTELTSPLPSPASGGERIAVSCSSVGRVEFEVLGELGLPSVPVREQPVLVIEELLAGLDRELEIRPFDDRIDRAGFLAEAAVNAFRHVDVVARRTAAAVVARLGLDGDRE